MLRRLRVALSARSVRPYVAVVRLQGTLVDATRPSPEAVNLRRFAPALEAAFASNPRAVALQVSSPGGSAVQSSLLFKETRALKSQYERTFSREIPVVSFVEDMALSGGYYIACAG
jgi:ClpP class serine protease